MNYKFKVKVTESEAGWGQRSEVEEYDSYEQAVDAINNINRHNTAKEVPSWYMRAEPFNFEIQ